jgi:two-component system, NarL family, nitrate/nitrite response regulator NarL
MERIGDTRVLIVGEDPLARGGLAVLLAGEPGVEVLGQVPPGAGTAAAVAGLQPEAVLWDLGVSPRSVPEGIGTLPAVVVLAADEELAAQALAAGARGALPRDAGASRLVAALRAAARGLVTLDESFASALLRPQPTIPEPLVEPLTPREIEVLQLLAEGLSNKEIGSRLGISESTAKFHVNAILGKLGAQGRTDAVVRAARMGLVLI